MAIAAPGDQNALKTEIDKLRTSDAIVTTQGKFEVYLAESQVIPAILHEIGRLRETCFRAVGEGSGREVDIDRFDAHYLHLFLWDTKHHRIAGAYRLGRTDLILDEMGPSGLYCSELFSFEQPFLDHLNPGLELGRSFVAPAYQRSVSTLSTLWKGIGHFIASHPCYARLFGPVSISNDYAPISQKLMVRFLRDKKRNSELARFVHPNNPFHDDSSIDADISPHLESIDQVSARLSEVEPDGKGVPVLLRQYLRLNATLLEFNIDPEFGNCLDALIICDLHHAPSMVLKRYMGAAGLARFLDAQT